MRVWFVLSIGCLLGISSLSGSAGSQLGAPLLGQHTVSVCARGSAPLYPPHLYHPTITIDVSSAPGGVYNLRFQVRAHTCDLKATASGNTLIVTSGQICNLEIVTSDFCTLKKAECDAGGSRQSCHEEARAGHLDAMIATVGKAELRPGDAQQQLSFDAAIAGCVLVTGFNNNIPIDIKRANVQSNPCP